jgi:diguanylate cyclase (GGDEF)-like protein/putative nucleotidyltransferase with HDIG domain
MRNRLGASRPGADGGPQTRERGGLTRGAAALYVAIVALTLAVIGPLLPRLDGDGGPWLTFAILAGGAALAQLFVVATARNYSLQTAGVFLVPAALLLPPELVALVAVVQHVPEWLKTRYPWYIQSFNICNYTLATLAAWASATGVLYSDRLIADENLRLAVGGLVAGIVFVLVNHAILAAMLKLARGHSLRESGLFSVEGLSTDLVLAALGIGVAALWSVNPWLAPFALAPLVLIHRALAVPQLQAEARVDPKTGLFNARHFAAVLDEELARAGRFERPLSLIMADLDLLRDVNNTYGHLAGDAVLRGVADVFREQLRHYDVPARFGGEEFSILLPETTTDQALEIAERIRRAVSERSFGDGNLQSLRVTISIGVATFPQDASAPNALIHEADLAVYRAKLQGRNRVLVANSEALSLPAERSSRPLAVAEGPVPQHGERRKRQVKPDLERRRQPAKPPRIRLSASRHTTLVSLVVASVGVTAGLFGLLSGAHEIDVLALLALVAFVGVGQALALDLVDHGALSVAAVGALAGAALFGPRAALVIAVATCIVDWSARRAPFVEALFHIGAGSLAGLAAALAFAVAPGGRATLAATGALAGLAYFVTSIGLLNAAVSLESRRSFRGFFRQRFVAQLPHYLVYGFAGAVIAIGYQTAGAYALAVFALPLLLMRRTQTAYLDETERSAEKLRLAAETIQAQNVSLERVNRLLKERSTAAMASLSATVDVRDEYTAGHAKRVQELALAIGRELNLSAAELDVLGHAALFHDIGKLSVPDAIMLKPAGLTTEEWLLMERHADDGARIIDNLGFLDDAVPAIRHHHERWDGTGYPDKLFGEEIPLGARVIHVADALDSMLTTRSYQSARGATEALVELRRGAGAQFCPRCVAAAERIFPRIAELGAENAEPLAEPLAAAS